MIPNPGSADIFIAAVDIEGNVIWRDYSGGSDVESHSAIDLVNDSTLLLGYRSLSQDGIFEGADEGWKSYIAYYDYQNLVSTKDVSNIEFDIYPNPTTHKIIIPLENYYNYGLRVYDINGNLLMDILALLTNEIDISTLPNGLMTISLYKNGKIVKAQSILKQ